MLLFVIQYSMLMESCKFIQRSEELRDEGQYSSSSVKEVGESLVRFISVSREVHHAPGLLRPLVILAFDDCQELTDRVPGDQRWTMFSELCGVLRGLHKEPIYSLFLLTGGDFHVFDPESSSLQSLYTISQT